MSSNQRSQFNASSRPPQVLLDEDAYLAMPTIVIAQNADRPVGPDAAPCVDLSSPDPKVPTALSLLLLGSDAWPPAAVNRTSGGAPSQQQQHLLQPPASVAANGGDGLQHQIGRAASADPPVDSATKYAARARGKVQVSPLFCPRKSTAVLPAGRANGGLPTATQVVDLTLDSDDDDDDVREILRTSRARASSAPREHSTMARMLFATSVRLERDNMTQSVAGSAVAPSAKATLARPAASTASIASASPPTPKLAQRLSSGSTSKLRKASESDRPMDRESSSDAPHAPLSSATSPERSVEEPLHPHPSAAVGAAAAIETKRERSPTSAAFMEQRRDVPKQPLPPAKAPHAVLAAVSGLSKTAVIDDGDGFAVPATKRPVDVALRGLFPDKFTFKGFTRDAARVVTPDHVLAPGEFWSAFSNATFLGEGSFGFVWRCVTQDGKTVAVKSSPIAFDCSEAIDDGYSVLREIAVLSFLNKNKVRNVLPMHAAFLCLGNEALPPAAAAVFAQHDEDARLLKKQQHKMPASDDESDDAGNGSDTDTVSTVSSSESSFAPESDDGGKGKRSEQQNKKKKPPPKNAKGKKKPAPKRATGGGGGGGKKPVPKKAAKTKDEITTATPAPAVPVQPSVNGGPTIRMPTFHAITRDQLKGSGATIFMVTQLCDGDLDSIDASTDANIARGVALSVSATLNDMHRLGLVHLDLKPGNILFRRVRVVGHSSSPNFQNGAATVLSSSSMTNAAVGQSSSLSPSQTTYFFGPAPFYGRASVSPTENGPPPPPSSSTRAGQGATSVLVGDSNMLSPGGTAYTTTGPRQGGASMPVEGAPGVVSTIALQFYLSDFGNAQVVGPAYHDDVACIGTYEYMDHAALLKKRCDRSTDCYSLGMTLYRLLTRKLLHVCKRKHGANTAHTPSCFTVSAKGKPPPLRGRLGTVVTALLNPSKALRMTAAGCYAALTAPAPLQPLSAGGTMDFSTASQNSSPKAALPSTSAAAAAATTTATVPALGPAVVANVVDEAAPSLKGRGRKAVTAALNRTAVHRGASAAEAVGVGAHHHGGAADAAAAAATIHHGSSAAHTAPAAASGAAMRRHGHSPYFVAS